MFRRYSGRRPLNIDQISLLRQANQLMSDGKPAQAAPLFVQLGRQMQATRRPRRAANLFARAANAFIDSHDEQAALTQARLALSLGLQYQMVQRTPVFFANITRKMDGIGMKSAAEALQREFGPRIASKPTVPPQESQPKRGLLPTICPKCGAPVHGDDINWVDENTAECEYCGNLIRTEK
jgi:hypothetical protein